MLTPLDQSQLSGWAIERGPPIKHVTPEETEVVRWRDATTPLTISLVETDRTSFHRMRFGPGMAVDVRADNRIVTRHDDNLPPPTMDHLLADQVIPRILARAGSFVVHAGAVRIGAGAVLFLGSGGRGKSTLTCSFDRSGFALLGDDAMIVSSLDGRPAVRAVYRSLRLFPDSIDAVMPGEPTAGPVAHLTSKERIDMPVDGDMIAAPLPVAAIFALGNAGDDGSIAIHPLTVAETCMALVESSFALDPSDVEQARHRLTHASAMARSVPAFEIVYPRDFARLPEVRQAILDQLAMLEPA